MLTEKLLHDSSMYQILTIATEHLERQGIICDVTSPKSVSFSSTLPEREVKEIFEGSSVPMKPSFEQAARGCRGTAVVQGIPRADE